MKRKIALFLSVLMVFMMIPIIGFGEEDKGLEAAITAAKTKLEIPKSFTNFNYDIYNKDNEEIWSLRWSSSNEQEGSIEVSVDKDGKIINYYYYRPYQKTEKKFPNYTKEAAKKISDEFIKKIDKDLWKELRYEKKDRNDTMSSAYYFNYIRLVNEIPFYDNEVAVEINKESGEVLSYRCNYTKNVTFPEKKGIVSLEKAQKAYMEELGLQLMYREDYKNEKIEPYLIYTTKYRSNYGIDAFTGKKTKINMPIIYYKNGVMEDGAKTLEENKSIDLTPEEIEAVKKVSSLLSKEEAMNSAKKFELLGITSDFKLNYASLNKNWRDKNKFEWYLSYEYENKEKKESKYVNVGMDATNGEIIQFNVFRDYDKNAKVQYNKEDGKKEAEAFLKKYYPQKYSLLKYDDFNEADFVQGGEKPQYYNFKFTRMVNEVPSEDQYLNIGYDAISGKIVNLNSQWYDVKFPDASKVVSMEKAYDILFNKIGLHLEYKLDYEDRGAKKSPKVKLVYTLNEAIPHNIDANTGEIIDYSRKPYIEHQYEEYKDIKEHYAKNQINGLKEIGIGFEGEMFYPNEKIKQKDFLKLYVKTLNYYGEIVDEKDLNNMYNYLVGEGVLLKDEVNPDKIMTKMDALKFMIKGLGHGEIAQIKGIYNCPFKDVIKETPEFVGYASIGHGLGIVSGYDGKLEPQKELTRGDAAIMIYNYLNR